MIGIVLFALAFLVSYVGIKRFRNWGVQKNRMLAIPNERSSHTEPIPHGAGLIIVIICLATYVPISILVTGTFSWGYIAGAVLVAGVSFIDDLTSLPAAIRLTAHSLAAILLIVDVDTWHGITMLGQLQLGNWGYVLTFLWIVWMVNSYNFMDGIDGLAGIQAVIAGAGWMVLGILLEMPAIYLFSGIIAASSLAFLIHNLSSSKIFMGDVGSAFLGFTFAALPLLARTIAIRFPDLLPIAAVLFVWFFLFDSLVTVVRRLIRGERFWTPHKEFFFHRLVRSGFTHRQVTVIYAILATMLSVTIILSVQFREDISYAIAPVVIGLTGILLFICYKRRVLG